MTSEPRFRITDALPRLGIGILGIYAAPAPVAAGWINFVEETDTRIVADAALVVNDGEEKDYAWGDFDRDGDIDLVIVRKLPFTNPGGRRNVLLMNEDGVLVDRTEEYILHFLDETDDRDVQIADLNGDGWLDVVTSTTFQEVHPGDLRYPRVYHNLGETGDAWQGFGYDASRIPAFDPGNLSPSA